MAANVSILRRADAHGLAPLLLRLLLGAYFVYMGAMKITDPIAFLKQVRLFEMLPESPPYFLNGTAIVLPWLEIICGVGLIVGLRVRGAGVLVAGLLCVFTPAILRRAIGVHQAEGTPFFQIAFDCGCGTGVVIIWKKLLSNLVCLAAAVLVVLSRSRRFTLTHLLDSRREATVYCRRCGYPLAETGGPYCENCVQTESIPLAAHDAAT